MGLDQMYMKFEVLEGRGSLLFMFFFRASIFAQSVCTELCTLASVAQALWVVHCFGFGIRIGMVCLQ